MSWICVAVPHRCCQYYLYSCLFLRLQQLDPRPPRHVHRFAYRRCLAAEKRSWEEIRTMDNLSQRMSRQMRKTRDVLDFQSRNEIKQAVNCATPFVYRNWMLRGSAYSNWIPKCNRSLKLNSINRRMSESFYCDVVRRFAQPAECCYMCNEILAHQHNWNGKRKSQLFFLHIISRTTAERCLCPHQ